MFSAKISHSWLTKHALKSKEHRLVAALSLPLEETGSILDHLAELIAALYYC